MKTIDTLRDATQARKSASTKSINSIASVAAIHSIPTIPLTKIQATARKLYKDVLTLTRNQHPTPPASPKTTLNPDPRPNRPNHPHPQYHPPIHHRKPQRPFPWPRPHSRHATDSQSRRRPYNPQRHRRTRGNRDRRVRAKGPPHDGHRRTPHPPAHNKRKPTRPPQPQSLERGGWGTGGRRGKLLEASPSFPQFSAQHPAPRTQHPLRTPPTIANSRNLGKTPPPAAGIPRSAPRPHVPHSHPSRNLLI